MGGKMSSFSTNWLSLTITIKWVHGKTHNSHGLNLEDSYILTDGTYFLNQENNRNAPSMKVCFIGLIWMAEQL